MPRRGRGAAGATPAGGACSPGARGAFFLRDARTTRWAPAAVSQVLGFPQSRVPFCPCCVRGVSGSGPGSRWRGEGRGGGGARAALRFCPGPWVRVAGRRGLGPGLGEGEACGVGLRAGNPRSLVPGHLWGRDSEPPVHTPPFPSALRWVQLAPDLGLSQPRAIVVYLETFDFCVSDPFTTAVQQLCKCGHVTPSFFLAPKKALTSSCDYPTR